MKNKFTKLIGSFHGYRSFDVFRDFVRMSTISLSQPFYRDEDRENEYLKLIGKYTKEDAEKFPMLFAITVDALEENHGDFLGEMFMEASHGSDAMGQFFTPYSVSRMLVQIQVKSIVEQLKTKEYVTVLEPSGGSGGMIVALDEVLKDKGINTAKKVYVHTTDLDPVACDMCYIHLALLGIPATVVHGNTLTLKTYRTLHTPVYFLNMWEHKLSRNEKTENIELYSKQEKDRFEQGVLF